MSSLTTSSEGENPTARFVVGSRDDETDCLGSNMKMDETDFFEDEEEEESVRSCVCTAPEAVGAAGPWPWAAWQSHAEVQCHFWRTVVLLDLVPLAAVNPSLLACRSPLATVADFLLLAA